MIHLNIKNKIYGTFNSNLNSRQDIRMTVLFFFTMASVSSDILIKLLSGGELKTQLVLRHKNVP